MIVDAREGPEGEGQRARAREIFSPAQSNSPLHQLFRGTMHHARNLTPELNYLKELIDSFAVFRGSVESIMQVSACRDFLYREFSLSSVVVGVNVVPRFCFELFFLTVYIRCHK